MPRLRLMLVDDSPDFLRAFQNLLKRIPDVEVLGTAESGEQALERVEALLPDLVLMDYYLPGMNGIEATRRIKERYPQIRVIVISLHDIAQYREAALHAGAEMLIQKSQLYDHLPELLKELPMTPPSPLHILVVDDSSTIRKMIVSALRSLPQATFVEAASGLEALEQLALQPIDLITLDLNMPDMHGLEVLQFVRSAEQYKNIPIVVVTTRGDEGTREQIARYDAVRLLTKPFAPDQLVKIAKESLHL
jgi:two-component system chemotaxis response regulator CheY